MTFTTYQIIGLIFTTNQIELKRVSDGLRFYYQATSDTAAFKAWQIGEIVSLPDALLR